MKNGKSTVIGKFTKDDILKVERIVRREIDLQNSTGWVSVRKVHKSAKSYTRKPKHKKDFSLF